MRSKHTKRKLRNVAVLLMGTVLLFGSMYAYKVWAEESAPPALLLLDEVDAIEAVEDEQPNWFTSWLAKKRAQWVASASDVINQEIVALDAERETLAQDVLNFELRLAAYREDNTRLIEMRQGVEDTLLMLDGCVLEARGRTPRLAVPEGGGS